SIAYAILRNRADAEDALQNAFVQAWEHLGDFHGGNLGGWFHRILVNQCLMRLRQRRASVSVDETIQSDHSFHLEVIDQRILPEDKLANSEVRLLVGYEVHALPPLLRNVLVMRELDQLGTKDIALQLGISEAAVKSRLTRARHELKDRMRRHLGHHG